MINILLTGANGNLSKERGAIGVAVRRAEEYVFPILKVDWDVDLLVTNRLRDMIIPEDGVGGRTITSDFIEFAIDEGKADEKSIAEMLVHEFCHAARWGKNDERVKTLFDAVISEGIATYFEAEFAKMNDEKTVFIETIMGRSDEENKMILAELWEQLDTEDYDYGKIFFNGGDELPRWAGYSLGYYLVGKYLEKNGKKIGDAFTDEYMEFRNCLMGEIGDL